MLDKLDKKWIGFLLGLFIPAFLFFCYWLFFHSQMGFPRIFINYLQNGEMLQEVCIACIAGNLLAFYLLLNKKVYDLSKGMIYAAFIYVGLVLYVSML